MTAPPSSVLVVIPAHSEAESLPGLLAELARAEPTYAIVVVDDGSTDDTGAIAERAGAAVIRHPRRRGYGAALVSGYRHALDRGYQVIVTLDGDGQHDPGQVGHLVDALDACDVAIGARRRGDPGYAISVPRRVGMRLFATLGRMLSGHSITDPTSGFAAVRRDAVAFLADNTPDDFPDLNVVLALLRAGFTVREVPVTMRPRRAGQSMLHGLMPLLYLAKMTGYIGALYLRGPARDRRAARRASE